MFKKIFSWLLIVCMLVTMTYIPAAADDGSNSFTVTTKDGGTVTIITNGSSSQPYLEDILEWQCSHSYEEVVAKEPGCETIGNIQYWRCPKCDAYFNASRKEITDKNSVIKPANGHTAGAPVVENEKAPDCVNAGSYDNVVYCTVCDKELSRDTVSVDALGHSYVDGVCSSCGDTKIPVQEDIKENETVKEILANPVLNAPLYDTTRTDVDSLEVSVVAVDGGKITFSVNPMKAGSKVESFDVALTFRLPIPASADEKYAIVYHAGEFHSVYEIKGSGDAKYVEVVAYDFSEYAVELHDHSWSDATCTEAQKCSCGETQGVALGHSFVEGACTVCGASDPDYVAPVAKIGETKYETLAAALEAAKAGDTITVIADVSDVVVDVDINITITGSATLNNVGINANGADSLTVSGLTFTGNSWINSGTAESLTVSDVTANVDPNNTAYTNSRSAFISLGRSEAQQLSLTVENCNIVSKSGTDPIIGWASITEANLVGNTFGSESAYQNSGDSVKFMAVADGAVINVVGNTVYSNYNGIVIYQNTSRDNSYTATFDGNTFMGSADHIWIELSVKTTYNGNINLKSNNTINGNPVTVNDIKTYNDDGVTGYAGIDVVLDSEGKVVGGTMKFAADDVIADGYELGEDGKVVEAKVYVAQIGETKYETLAAALAAAKTMTGDVVVSVLGKATLSAPISGSFSSIKFVGVGETAEIYIDLQGAIYATGKVVAFEDLKLSKVAGGFVADAGFRNLAFGIYAADEVVYTDCIFLNGAYASSGDNTFTGCTFYPSHDRYGMWAYGDADIIIDDCTFAGIRGIKMYSEGMLKTGNLTVKNTDFSAADNKPAIVLTSGNSITLENNTYSSAGVLELDLDGVPNGTLVTSTDPITCVNDNGVCGVLVDGKIYTTVADAAEVAVSGSTVTLLHNSTESVELAEGVTLDKNGYTADGVTVAVPAPTSVEVATLAELLAALADNSNNLPIIITATIVIPQGETVVLDLNGKNVSMTQSESVAKSYQMILNKGNLTITGDGTLSYKYVGVNLGTTYYANTITSDAGSVLTVNGGTIENLTYDSAVIAYAIDGHTNGGAGDVKITVNGGKITSLRQSVRIFANSVTNTGSLIINGGEFVGRVIVQNANGNANKAALNISGGSFAPNAYKTDVLYVGGSNGATGAIDAAVSGGTFTGVINSSISTGFISGGSFSTPIADEFCAEGFEPKDNGDGTYGVVLDPTYGKVAQIGDTYYATLAEAIAVAVTGDTITLLSDATVEGTLAIPAGVTIQSNGYTINGSIRMLGDLKLDGALTITGGLWVGKTGETMTATLSGDKLTASYFMFQCGTYTINANIDAVYGYLSYNGIFEVNSTIHTTGTNGEVLYINGEVTLNNGAVLDSDNSVFINSSAVLTMVPGSKVDSNLNLTASDAKLCIDAGALTEGEYTGITGTVANSGTIEIVNNDALEANVVDGKIVLSAKPSLSGSGTESDPFIVGSLDDLKLFRDMVNGGTTFDNQYIKLTADIDLGGEAWTPIGNATNKFLGTFDGGNYTISNLVVNVNTNNAGLFGFASVIKNLKLVNAKVSGIISVGALVGELESSVGTLDNCHVSGLIQITGENSVGGLAGKGYANIKNCSVDGSVTTLTRDGETSFVLGVYGTTEEGDNVGGLIGHLGEGNTLGVANSTVKNIKVSGTRKVGGLVGTTARGNDYVGNTVENVTVECTATAEYANANAATTTIGGIIGNYFGSSTSGGILADSTVSNVTFIVGNAKSAGALAGGDRNNNGGAPVGVEASGSTVTDVIGATNKYLIPVAAKIGTTEYATIEEALAAAKDGDEIVLLADVDGDITIPAGVIFNGNGFVISGGIIAEGDITFAGATKASDFDVMYTNTTVNIPAGATLELTGTDRMVIGHGCIFNITGNITDAKTANVADLTPSLIVAAGASFTGTGLTFNVTNAYVKFNANSTSKNKAANGTFNFNINNSIWEQTGVLAFYVPTEGMDPTFNLNLKDSVLNSTSHLVFAVTKGEIVIDNSNVNVGKSNQIENRSTMTIKNGSVVNGLVATSSNAINSGTIIVENATYAVTGQFSGSTVGTGTLIIKQGATVSVGSIVDKANIVIDATGMSAGDEVNFTANLSKFAGDLSVINNDELEAKIVDGKIALSAKPGLSGSGTESDPYLITSLEDLILFRDAVNKGVANKYNDYGVWVVLAADIDLAGINWTPIGSGTTDHGFMGNFDGKGFKIKNLTITDPEIADGYAYAGFFGVTEGRETCDSIIKNLTIENVTISTTGHIVAAAIAYPYYTTVDNVTVCGNISISGGNYTAGVLGYTRRCYNASNLTVSGNDGSTISGNQVVGGVISDIQSNGGLVNYSGFSASNITVTGTVNVGGISGIISGQTLNGATVKNVTLVCSDARVGIVSGSLGSTSTVSNVVAENVTGATAIIGGTYDNGAAVQAKVGDKYYASFASAYEAAQAGETVTLLEDITSAEIITIDKAITLDGNGKTLTSTAGRAINVSGADGVTIKNLTINAKGERAINVIQNATNVTIENVTATAANYTVNLASSAPNAVVAIKNSTLTGLCTVNVTSAGARVTVDNSTINCNDNNTTAGESYAALSITKEAIGASIIATGTTVNVTEGSDSSMGRNGAENATVTINGSTEDVLVIVAVITYAGQTAYHGFASLAEAIEFAKSGDTVTLIRDVETSEVIMIGKSITIDLNGKALTGTLSISAVDIVLTAAEGLTVETDVPAYDVDYSDGAYKLVKDESVIAVDANGVEYEDLYLALRTLYRNGGGKLTLMNDVLGELDITVFEGITLDLNGYTLETEFVTVFNGGYLIDSSADNTGLLKCPQNHTAIQTNVVSENGVMSSGNNVPVWDDAKSGYIFTDYIFTGTKLLLVTENEVTKLQYQFAFFTEKYARALLKDGSSDNDLAIIVRVSWTKDGVVYDEDVRFTDDQIGTVVGENGANKKVFGLNVSNYENFENLTFQAIVLSGTEMVASTAPIAASSVSDSQ